MGLGDIIHDILPVIKEIVGGQGGVLDTVTIEYWEEDANDSGTASYSDPVTFDAVVERKQQVVLTSSGQEVMSKTRITFIEAMQPHGTGKDRREPLDERDVITLSDGTTGPILSIDGLMDQTTSAGFILEVYLG